MKVVLLSFVALALSLPAGAQTKEDADTAMTFYVRCLGSAAQRLDDGVSDAQTVAIAIESSCDEYKRHAVRLFVATMDINPDSPSGQDIMQTALDNRDTAVNVVLTTRGNAAAAAD